MTTAQEILRLIETVDPADTAKLDEIDARVWCFINGKVNHGSSNTHIPRTCADGKVRFAWTEVERINGIEYIGNCMTVIGGECPQYTRSRDALKAIRTEGWAFDMGGLSTREAFYEANKIDEKGNPEHTVSAPISPTEELAELHAIIQAIEYERNKN